VKGVIRDLLAAAVADALRSAGVDPPAAIPLERPARREHGDWSCTVALAVAKAAGRNPRVLGQQLVDHLAANPPRHVTKVDLAGPGFVNFHLAETWLHDVLADVLAQGSDGYASPDLGHGAKVNVEFISANPNTPIHAGHGRGACLGDSIARLLERTGHRVTREYLLNDRGVQMQLFATSLAARKRGEEPPEGGYQGDYLIDWAAEMPDGADPLEWGRQRAIDSHRATAERLGVHFDVWHSERSMVGSGAIEQTVADLRDHGVVFEQDNAVWFRSTDFGDDKDRVLVKSDGDYTYLTPDIAYHRDKYARGFDHLIDVWGADHHGYIPRVRAAIQALGHDPATFEVEITQMVDLVRDGEELKMSGRAGNAIWLDWLLDQVGVDAARFTYLQQSADTRQTFDLDLVTRQTMDNPVYYVQYAHARVCRMLRRAGDDFGVTRLPTDQVDLSPLVHDRELDIARTLSTLPEVVAVASRERAPHKVITWLRELAGNVQSFYQDDDMRVLGEGVDPAVTQARLALVDAARCGLQIGLDLVGVSAPTSM
jgi:arginyl-tRNA synthetase